MEVARFFAALILRPVMVSNPSNPGFFEARGARQNALSGNALATGAMLLWAAGFPAAEILLDVWHPIALMMLRLAMAMAVLLPLWVLADGLRTIINARWGRGIWIGVLGFGTGTNLLLFAQWYTDPVTVALIATTTPICATIIEVWNRQRKLTGRFLVGLVVSVCGGIVAIGANLSIDLGWGVLMAVAAGFCFTWASYAANRDFPDMTPIGRSTITFSGAALMTGSMFLTLWTIGAIDAPQFTSTNQIGLLAIYAVAAMALSQILFIASVGKIGIALTSFHLNIAPFYLMVILVALGGVWDWRVAFGASIVGLGVLISQTRRTTATAGAVFAGRQSDPLGQMFSFGSGHVTRGRGERVSEREIQTRSIDRCARKRPRD